MLPIPDKPLPWTDHLISSQQPFEDTTIASQAKPREMKYLPLELAEPVVVGMEDGRTSIATAR